MPYLRSVANNKGRWGISNTRVPTESRPGHVAIIAGFYEDPSAVAKGWKENPVDFDSIFNQSSYTWCWGTDTAGHTHKPKTQNFLTTLKYVDEGIKDIEKLIRDFYKDDGRTTFLMTADHGMTDWGSHGTGYEHETKTPYVLWGSGVEKIWGEKNIDQETNTMFYEHRFDLNQADLTPLMATFLSIPVPVNSIGQLKPNLMNLTLSNKAKAVYSNSRQLLSQYNQKRLDVEANALSILYNPYKPLDGRKVDELLHFTEMLLKHEEYEQLIIFSEEIMNLSLLGLIYYHNYYQTPLLITITVSFLGWITYLLRILMEQSVFSQIDVSNKKYQVTANVYKTVDKSILGLSIFTTILSSIIIYAQSLPIQYYIYFNLPIFLWYHSLSPIELWIQTYNMFIQRRHFWTLIIGVLCYTLGSIAIGFSFSYRWVLSIPLLGISLWPTFSRFKHNIKTILYWSWPTGCLLLSIFSFSPVVGKDVFIELVFLGGFLWLLVLLYHVWFIFSPHTDNEHGIRDVILSIVHMVILTIALQIIYIQSKRFAHGAPISQVLQTVCWFIGALLPILPLMYTRKMNNRILGINSSTIIFYLLMSVAHEGLFIIALIFNITCWMYIEFKLLDIGNKEIIDCYFESDEKRNQKHLTSFERSISSDDFRRAFFFLLYIVLSYFGTGNIDSLNSYEVRWVLCFTTSFQPFLITGLIVMKTLSTQLSVACCFRAIQNLTKAPIGYTHIIVLIYSNIMGLLLLYCVTNTGSWLEIGTSISQFVIVQILTLIIVLINQLAKLLTYVDIFQLLIKLFKNRKKYV
ncbi:unnamed protein product [Pieris brassicae]|uniref:GPI ethanolamine phosphate transferase 1 n=1 Tax=Pieris brassicae TaxID=7116 RepID=A0A9P0TF33_PIEBR|nr:unnamed protein product [Pieris brassicae]